MGGSLSQVFVNSLINPLDSSSNRYATPLVAGPWSSTDANASNSHCCLHLSQMDHYLTIIYLITGIMMSLSIKCYAFIQEWTIINGASITITSLSIDQITLRSQQIKTPPFATNYPLRPKQ